MIQARPNPSTPPDDGPPLNPLATAAHALLGSPGLLAVLRDDEFRAAYHLVNHAWENAGRLRDDNAELAFVTGMSIDQWTAARPRVMLVLRCTPLPEGWLSCPAVAEAYSAAKRQADDAARLLEAQRASGRRGAERRWKSASDPPRTGAAGMGSPWAPHRVPIGSPSAPAAEEARAPAQSPLLRCSPVLRDPSEQLHRETQVVRSPEANERQRPEVLALVGSDGARAIEDRIISDWCREEATKVLMAAFRGWLGDGLTTIPLQKVMACARECPDPALADWAVESARDGLARAQAKGETFNLFGWVVTLLGLRKGWHRSEPPLWVVERWSRRAQERRRLAKAEAAIEVRRVAAGTSMMFAQPVRATDTRAVGGRGA